MRTVIRLATLLSLVLVPAAACSKSPAKATTATAGPAPASSAKKAPDTTKGDVGLAVTGPDADHAPPSGPVYFEFDSATLTQPSRDLLATLGAWLATSSSNLRIEGHTDEQGTSEYNVALGDRRAAAIADYLATLGVDRKRLATVSFGEEKPATAGEGEAANAQNRRGEVKTE